MSDSEGSNWVSVGDSVPEFGIPVIVYDPSFWKTDASGGWSCSGTDNVGEFTSNGWALGGGPADGITHWMYFPSPPAPLRAKRKAGANDRS